MVLKPQKALIQRNFITHRIDKCDKRRILIESVELLEEFIISPLLCILLKCYELFTYFELSELACK
jgi:hypothetical protein